MGEDPHYKIIMLGNSGVGKTALVQRMAEDTFNDSHVPTVGAQFVALSLEVNNKKMTLELWDTAGQEVYRSLVGFYTREAKGAFLVFDVTDSESFEKLGEWIKFAQDQAPGVKIILFGNKIDLDGNRKVESSSIREFADQKGIEVIEGSAKTGQNCREAFEKMGELMSETEGNAAPQVEIEKEAKKGKKGCC